MGRVVCVFIFGLFVEFFLLAAIYLYNGLTGGFLPEGMRAFDVFHYSMDIVRSEATGHVNIIGIITACVLRGWLYFCAHALSLALLEHVYETFTKFTIVEATVCNAAFAGIVLWGVDRWGLPDVEISYYVVYVASLVIALLLAEYLYIITLIERAKERKLQKEITNTYKYYNEMMSNLYSNLSDEDKHEGTK